MTFAQDISGRTVAVVGPAPPVGDQSDEIESHDFVVRLAWFGDDPVPGAGKRTDISYYNNHLGQQILAGQRTLPDLRWACFKHLGTRLMRPNWRHAARCQPKVRNPNMVPVAVHDVLAAGAARVKVFAADFYLSPTPYADDPHKHRSAGIPADAGIQEIMAPTLRCHDQMAQRKFMRSLLGAHPQLTGDERFLRVLAIDDVAFERQLKDLWPEQVDVKTFRHARTGAVRRVRANHSLARSLARRPEWEEVT